MRNDKKNGFPVKLGMTKRDKGMRFHLSFPNVSIGNPESSKRNGFPVKLGMTEREWIPDQVGDDRERWSGMTEKMEMKKRVQRLLKKIR